MFRETFFVALMCVCGKLVQANRPGVIVTTPNTWLLNTEEKICVSFHNIDFNVMTQVDIETEHGVNITKRVVFEDGIDGCFTMILTGVGYNKKLHVQAYSNISSEGTKYSFTDSRMIQVQDQKYEANVTFIETDKPMYKPGDKVQLRILTIQEELKPRLEMIPLITIENPAGQRIRQWRDLSVESQQGLASLTFELSTEPALGDWHITAQRQDGHKHKQMFKVMEYVLPKFEVQIMPASHLPAWKNTTDTKICAKYTYGQDVKGMLNVVTCAQSRYNYYMTSHRGDMCVTHDIPIDGCTTLTSELVYKDDIHAGIYLKINATVTEEGTGAVISSDAETDVLSLKHYEIEFMDTPTYFKPGIDFIGKVMVTDLTGESVKNVPVKITLEHTENAIPPLEILLADDGIVNFQYADMQMDNKSDYIIIKAEVISNTDYGEYDDKLQRPVATMSIQTWFSISNSYLAIRKLPDSVACEATLDVRVFKKLPQNHELNLVYKVVAQEKLILQSMKEDDIPGLNIEDDHFDFTITLPEMAWGPANLLLYTVVDDGEVIADRANFEIKHCANNKVSMEFSQPEVAPGDEVTIAMSAGAGSLCAYGVMDKSMKLLGGDNMITMDSIMKKIPMKTSAHYYSANIDTYCQKKIEEEEEEEKKTDKLDAKAKRRENRRQNRKNRKNRKPRSIMPHNFGWYSRYVDSNTAFQKANLLVLSDLLINTRPCDRQRQHHPYLRRRLNSPMMRKNGAKSRPVEVFDDSDNFIPEMDMETAQDNVVVDTIRSFFPEAWLWDIVPIGTDGTAEVEQTAPDTITEWTGHAMCTSTEHGLGISNEATLRTFQPFFVSLSLPYAAVRGETLLLPVSVFNYLSECLVISLEILPSSDYTIEGKGRSEFCVCGQEKITHKIPITAQVLGYVNVTVRAESMDNAFVCGNVIMSSQVGVRDTVIRELLIEAEGKEEEKAFSSFLCPGNGDTMGELHQWNIPSDIVPDSLRIYVSAMGDVMGPALSGLDSLLRLPTGCGEQNMLKFAPNIYILQYLTNMNELSKDIEEKALNFLQIGYQREMEYRHNDGSYSAFGTSDDEGSTWLTAFVLKSFAQAADFIDIDQSDLRITKNWFERSQLENGCFRNAGRIIHKSMKGGLASDENTLAPLTAYSLVALLEAGYDPQSEMITLVIDCLSQQTYSDVYSAALVSYAFSLLGRDFSLAHSALDKLDQFKTSQGGMSFWKTASSELTSDPDHDYVIPADVETTAYALLAHINMAANPLDDLYTTLPIVRWLTAQRNPEGGFLSTQDTVVALQALAKFAELIKSELGSVDINVRINEEEHDFSVNSDNHLLLQKHQVMTELEPGQLTDITMETTGEGCVFVQTSMKYNIFNVTKGSTHNIHLSVTTSRTPENTCYHRILKTCIRYDGPDDATNMALLDVKMVTGWSPIRSSVEKLLQDTTLHISRYEVDKKNVNFYFNELMRGQDICLEFDVQEDIEVRNPKPATVTVYDYYDQQEVFYQEEYRLRSICGTKEELPFGKLNLNEGEISQQRLPDPVFPGLPEAVPEPEQIPCPRCDGETIETDELKEILCKSAHVFRGMVKNPGTMKVHKDLVQNQKISKVTAVGMTPNCECATLDTAKQWVWIISNSTEIQTVSRRKNSMELSNEDIIIPVAKKSKVLERLLKKVKRSKHCKAV